MGSTAIRCRGNLCSLIQVPEEPPKSAILGTPTCYEMIIGPIRTSLRVVLGARPPPFSLLINYGVNLPLSRCQRSRAC